MIEETHPPSPLASPMRRFFIGFFSTVAFFILLNIASYFAYSIPEDHKFRLPGNHKIGSPKIFWVEDRLYPHRLGSEFYWGSFLFNLVLICAASFSFGRWLQERGKPGEAPPSEPTSTPLPP